MSDGMTWADIERMENPPDKVECGDCGSRFTPDGENEKFCSRCNAIAVAEANYNAWGPNGPPPSHDDY